MAKSAEREGKQRTLLDAWRCKTPQQLTKTVHIATKCSQKQNADDALKQIFGYEAYKSDVQQKAVSAVLTGCSLLPCLITESSNSHNAVFESWYVNPLLFFLV